MNVTKPLKIGIPRLHQLTIMSKKFLPWVKIGLFLWACCLATTLHAVGILAVRPEVEPVRIKPGDKATLAIDTRDGFQRPLSGVMVKVTAETGYFEATHKPLVQGATDQNGIFRTVWQSEANARGGSEAFYIEASKSGYIGRYPIMATIIIEVPGQQNSDLGKSPSGEDGESEAGHGRFDPRNPLFP